MARKLLIAGAALAVLIVGSVAFLASNLDALVARAIETIGPEMARVSVKVSKVSIALADGRGQIGGLVVGNPAGYKSPHAFRLGSITLAIDPLTVTKDVILIRELIIEAPDMYYEKGAGGSNVEVIQRNVDEYVRTHFGSSQKADKADKSDPAHATRFIVDRLEIRNGKVHLAGMAGREAEVALPPLSLHNIGRSRGVTGGELASIVVKQMTSAVVGAAARALGQGAKDRAKEGLKGVFGR